MTRGKVVGDVSSKENHYVYRRSSGNTTRNTQYQVKERLHTRSNKVKHSTHRHPLLSYKILKEDKVVCTICEIDITGLAYGCDQEDCDFFIHESCLQTPAKIKHWSHKHPLTLLPSPVYASGIVLCDACRDHGEGYHYHCGTCKFDLHIACLGLPERVRCNQHRYPLVLLSEQPIENNNKITSSCNVCNDVIILKGWIYYNRDTKFVAHLNCAFTEEIEESVIGIQDRLLSLEVDT